MTIAGVRFALSGADSGGAFSPPFADFLDDSVGPVAQPRRDDPAGKRAASDLDCAVTCLGPDDALEARPRDPDNPWSFTVREGLCEVVRRDQEGEALWQLEAPLAFDRVAVRWNPRLFEEFYGSYESAWGTGLGLSLLVLRLCARGGLVLHGNAADVDGHGILCVGISGKGKSTLARLLDAAGATVLTDERPVLRQTPPTDPEAAPGAPFRVHGSPWPSSAGFARNASAPLRRIYFIEHGATDRLTPLAPPEAMRRLIHVATLPWQDPALVDPCLATLDALLRAVPCAVLAFRPTPAVVDLIRDDLRRP